MIRANAAPWFAGVELLILNDNHHPCIEMVYDPQHTSGKIIKPSITLPIEHAQTLMDDLYASGIRPSEDRTTNNTLEAVQYHLEDMRMLLLAQMSFDED